MGGFRSSSDLVRFAGLRTGPASRRTAQGDGTRIRLQEQPLQILRILLEQPGRIIAREELRQKVWPSDTFVDFDHGINNAIKRLREALGDTERRPRAISRRCRDVAIGSCTAVASTSRRSFNSGVAVPESQRRSLKMRFFAMAQCEEIISSLAQIKNLHVIARTSSFSFKGKHVDLRAVGQQLNVRTVLEGSVRRSGNRLRITAQLVNAEDGYHLWSETYDREMKDVFAVQEEIANSIAQRLEVAWILDDNPFQSGHGQPRGFQVLLAGALAILSEEGCTSFPLSSASRRRSLWIQSMDWHGRGWRTPTTRSASRACET